MPEMQEHWSKAKTFSESLSHALRGLTHTFKLELNFRRQFSVFVVVLAAAVFLRFSVLELTVLVAVSCLVLCLELVNTALELLADVVEPAYHDKIGLIKDVTAGAVLVASIGAIIVGLLLFVPAMISVVGV